jgi:predicted nucleotidyltransferase/uncharacterized protein with HEPN domain
MPAIAIEIDKDKLRDFCRKWKITEFFFFGSVLREDFRWDSDVDVAVTFADDAHWTLFDIVHAQDELAEIFDRKVDLLEKCAVEKSTNYLRRESILTSLVALEDIDSFVPRSALPVPRAQHALYDILLAGRAVIAYTRDTTRQEWAHDAKTREASLFRLSCIGRATDRVDPAARSAFPSVPWELLARLEELTDYRYVPRHIAEIWMVITHELPAVVSTLESHFSESAA